MGRMRNAWQTLSGLVTLSDVLGTIGFWLYRGTLRRTLLFVIALGGAMLADKNSQLVNLGLTTRAAVGTASIVFAVSCLGGAALMFIGGSFSKSALRLGEAKGGNLLEDLKKSRQPIHRERLWNHVFRYERQLFTASDVVSENQAIDQHRDRLEALCNPASHRSINPQQRIELERIIGTLGLTYTGWIICFDHAMFLPLPRSVLRHQLRFDLSKLKDWYDGAPFHHTDTKLQQQFDAEEHLQEAKKDARLTRFFLLTHTRKRLLQSIWFKVITRAIQLRVARACRWLDRKYPPFHFSIDQFLWPNLLTDDLIRKESGSEALEDLIDLRTRIFQRVFKPEPELALRLMQRAIYPNFEGASQLRRLYDPQYVLGELGETWAEDVVRYNRAFTPQEREAGRRRLFIQRTRREQDALTAYLAQHVEIDVRNDPEALRALRIAVHVDHDGLKTLLLGEREDRSLGLRIAEFFIGRSPRKPNASAEEVIRKVIAQKELYRARLLAVRMHQELTRCELDDYEHYLNAIMGGNVAAKVEDAEKAVAES